MNEEKLIGYINGEITSEVELIEILNWIESTPENQKSYTQLKNLWVFTGLDHPDQVAIPAFPFSKTRRPIFQKRVLTPLLQYAAIFILAFVLGSLSLYLINRSERNQLSSLYNTIDVPYGERSQISLYDGTKVWLNSGTKFRYPVAFGKDSRDVFVEGEAYFDVAKDPDHPFIVRAGQLKIKVLGTHFNVCAYPDDNEFSTTLDEGSVNAINTVNCKGVKLNPGEQVILNRETNGLKCLSVDTRLYTSWKENLLKFEDAPFEEVIKRMERWYDVKITVDPSINTRERYTITIKTESLREMLQLVSKTTKMSYEIKGNTVALKKP
jgi:ferric-dicitrate binding protein FerR (iron transport regulator)